MGVHHGWTVRRFVRRGAAGAALVACSSAPLTASAYPLQASITGFVKNVPSVTGVAGNYIRASDVRYLNSIAATEARVITAGRTIAMPVAIRAASSAGSVIAAACFANPILCGTAVAGGALAAWFLSSKIHIGPDGTYLKDEEKTVGSVCWRSSATGAAGPCFGGSYGAAESGVFVPGGATLGTGTPTVVDPEHQCYSFPVTRSSGITDHVEACADAYPDTATEYETRPATEADFEEHAGNRPIHVGLNPDNQIGWSPDAVLDASPVPVPVEAPVFEPVSEPLGQPYPGPEGPSTGPWKVDTLKLTGKPDTPDPLDVEADPVTTDADNPNTPEDESPVTGPGGETPETPMEDPCKLHPESVMCTDLGTAPGDEIPRRSVSVDYSAETVGLPVGCPAPVPMGRFGVLSFDGACDAALTAKPFVIAFAALAAAMLMLAAIRRQ